MTVRGSIFMKILAQYSQSEIQATKKEKKNGIQESKKTKQFYI